MKGPRGMRRALLIIAMTMIFLSSATYGFSGPFGFYMGMTKEQIGEGLEQTGPNRFQTTSPPRPDRDFYRYGLLIDPELGLTKIVAIGHPIPTSSFGTELKRQFEVLENSLIEKYGKNEKYDFLHDGSLWKRPQDWMLSLKNKERVLTAFWGAEIGSDMKDNLQYIKLEARAIEAEWGGIVFICEFENAGKASEQVGNGKVRKKPPHQP